MAITIRKDLGDSPGKTFQKYLLGFGGFLGINHRGSISVIYMEEVVASKRALWSWEMVGNSFNITG